MSVTVLTVKHRSLYVFAAATMITIIFGLNDSLSHLWPLVAVVWVALALLVAVYLVRHRLLKILIWPFLLVLFMVFMILLSRELIFALLAPMNEMLDAMNVGISAGKVGHIICFFLLTTYILVFRQRLGMSHGYILVFLVIFMAATESMQFFIRGRTSSWMDFGYDIIGTVLGYIAYSFVSYCIIRSAKPDTAK